jgi:hypothetical protein
MFRGSADGVGARALPLPPPHRQGASQVSAPPPSPSSTVDFPPLRGCSAPLGNRPPPSSAWSHRLEQERLAGEIKSHLFRSLDRDRRDLEATALDLEHALSRIPGEDDGDQSWRESVIQTDKAVESDAIRPACYSDGLMHECIHAHSWRPSGPKWMWISKASAAQGLGYPARRSEILRFGWHAKRV